MTLGEIAHRDIDLFLRHKSMQKHLGGKSTNTWDVWFTDSRDRPAHTFLASSLSVDGKPLSCIPDAVLYEKHTNSFLIIERKTTTTEYVPKAGWPNVEAQLWCYSHINELREATHIQIGRAHV